MSLFGCDHGPLIAQLERQIESVERARAMQVTYFETVVADLRQDYADLLTKYHALKQAGATLPPMMENNVVRPIPNVKSDEIPGWPITLPAAEPDELKALIDAQCGRDYRKRAMMLAQLATDRAGNVDPEAIRAAILNGVQAEGVHQ